MANPWSSAFPQRPGMPASGVVQSDDEFNQDWRYQVDQTPRYLGELNPSAFGYDPQAANTYWHDLKNIPFNAEGDKREAGISDYNEKMLNTFRAMEGGTSYNPAPTPNPEYQKVLDAQAAATAQRGENQTRQQQAFDTGMMGNGAIGGVMPSDYASPTYGQITGQTQGGLGGLGGVDLTGIDNTQQTGAYMGGAGAYNPSPWASNTFQNKNPWSGF